MASGALTAEAFASLSPVAQTLMSILDNVDSLAASDAFVEDMNAAHGQLTMPERIAIVGRASVVRLRLTLATGG